ncbi:hypothetical protein [Nocardia aurantiaca]|uniref:Uncharacterized protein n=1 Tax=Nocardia aurantiaca TaxID=2675850 RepID=A0A6I3KYX6_9NOCA|nr:hypothetical protein [Nocardia aurantiaca]MTE14178.1 hypothetical protein [Nocardia aurantiaca]
MDRLALELGRVEVCAHRENQYGDEFRQWDEFRHGTGVEAQTAGAKSAESVELPDADKAEIEQGLTEEEDERRRRASKSCSGKWG